MSKPNQQDSQHQDTGTGANKQNQGITNSDNQRNQQQSSKQEGQPLPGTREGRPEGKSVTDELDERNGNRSEEKDEEIRKGANLPIFRSPNSPCKVKTQEVNMMRPGSDQPETKIAKISIVYFAKTKKYINILRRSGGLLVVYKMIEKSTALT